MRKWQQKVHDLLEPEIYNKHSAFVHSFIFLLIFITTVSVILQTFPLELKVLTTLYYVEIFCLIFFTLEFFLRLWVAPLSRPNEAKLKARWHYVSSFAGLIDLMSILPFILPFIFPTSMSTLRILRAFRFARILKAGRYLRSVQIFTNIIRKRGAQLFSALMILVFLILFSSLLLFEFENAVQPDKIQNIFDAIWLAIITLTTVGFGDVTPITMGGKIVAGIIILLGIGVVAIPTGIISAGFYEEMSHRGELENEYNYCPHCGKKLHS